MAGVLHVSRRVERLSMCLCTLGPLPKQYLNFLAGIIPQPARPVHDLHKKNGHALLPSPFHTFLGTYGKGTRAPSVCLSPMTMAQLQLARHKTLCFLTVPHHVVIYLSSRSHTGHNSSGLCTTRTKERHCRLFDQLSR
jgi:hypothetical protein